MDTWELIVLGVLAVLALLAAGGAMANFRHRRDDPAAIARRVEEANRALADAHAQDRGWEPSVVEATARRAFTERRPGVELRELSLVQVVDRPGTDEDKAVFRCVTEAGESELTLGRRGGEWTVEDLN